LTSGELEESLVIKSALVDVGYVLLIEPFDPLSVFPEAILYLALLGNEIGSETVLFALPPVALVASAVSPGVDTESMLFIILLHAFIFSSVVPDVVTVALHIIALPLSLVLATV
jgi:hypothetical protein